MAHTSKISHGAIALTIAVAAAVAVSPLASQPGTAASDWSTVKPILQRKTSVLTSAPTQTPEVNVTSDSLNIPDGSFMGNSVITGTDTVGTAAS